MSKSSILRLDQVSKRFSKTDFAAVDCVSFELNAGEILGLLGPSGCGKTTLLRLIAGFAEPDQGRIELSGRFVAQSGICVPPECRSVGMVFQDFALFPHLTVAENIAFGLKSHEKRSVTKSATISTSRSATIAVQEAIALVNLEGKENRYPHELSGGQQQRVALARALAPRPSLILLDEPLSNLDVQVRLYLRQEVREILKATGTSAIFVTHDQEEAMAIADRVAVMRQGQIEQIATPEEVYREPASRFVAEFVTQANFLFAQESSHFWETEIGRFSSQQVLCACQGNWDVCAQEGNQGDLMIRQEDLHLEMDETANVVVRDRQFLGREYRYCLSTSSGQRLHARTDLYTQIPVGATVRLSVSDAKLQFFPTVRSQNFATKSLVKH